MYYAINMGRESRASVTESVPRTQNRRKVKLKLEDVNPIPGMRILIPKCSFRGIPKSEGGDLEYHLNNIKQRTRNYVFQGELLQFYVIVPSQVVKTHPWLRTKALEDKKDFPSGKSSLRLIDFEVDVKVLDQPGGTSVLSHLQSDAHSSPGGDYGSRSYPRCWEFDLSNGDLILVLQTILSVSSGHEQSSIALEVCVVGPRFDYTCDILDHIQPDYCDVQNEGSEGVLFNALRDFVGQNRQNRKRVILKTVMKDLSIVHPIQAKSSHSICGDRICLSIGVENVHRSVPITITDVCLHLNRTRYNILPGQSTSQKSESQTRPLAEYFTLYFEKENLPCTLEPQEQQNFILFLEPVTDVYKQIELSRISHHFRTRYTITWECRETSVPTHLQETVTWTKLKHHPIMLAFQTEESPVTMYRSFSAHVSVFNGDTKSHTFTIVILPTSHPLVLAPQQPLSTHPTPTAHASAIASSTLTSLISLPRFQSPKKPEEEVPQYSRAGSASALLARRSISGSYQKRSFRNSSSTVSTSSSPIRDESLRGRGPSAPIPIPGSSRKERNRSATTGSSVNDSPVSLERKMSITSPSSIIPQPLPTLPQPTSSPTKSASPLGHELLDTSESSILCLETNISLGVIQPNNGNDATLHFLPLREGLLELNNIFLHDEEENTYYRLDKSPRVFVVPTPVV